MTEGPPAIEIGELPMPAALVDGGGRVVAVSVPFEELVGLGSDSVCGMAVLDLVAPEDRGRLASAWTGSTAAEIEVAGVGGTGLPFVATFSVPDGDPTSTRLLVARRRVPAARWSDVSDAGGAEGRNEVDSALSHDVRGALRGVAGFLSVLDREESALSEDSRGFLATARRSAAAADAMAEKLVEYTRLAQRPLVVSRVDLAPLLAGLVDELAPGDGERAPAVSVGPLVPVVGNRALLGVLFAELLTNAAKFGASAVDVSGHVDDPWVYVRVADDGPGIDDEFRARVFDLFRMLQPKGRYPGIGAGLALVRRTAEVHGGTVWVESSDRGGVAAVVRLVRAT